MDNTPRPEQGSECPFYCATDTNASFLTTYEEIREADIQTPLQDFNNIVEIQSNKNASISTSDSSRDADEAISATEQGCENICSSVNKQDSQFSSPHEASSDFEMSSGSRNHLAPNDTVIVSSVHTHKRKESVIVSSPDMHKRKRSVSNDRMTSESNSDHKKSKPEIFVRSCKDISTDSEQDTNKDYTLELNATSQISVDNSALAGIDDQNIESNSNISETDPDYNAPSKISDSIESERGSICSVDDCLAMPSGLPENNNTSNLCGKTFQSFTCRVCKVAIAEHATEENTFQCCNCSCANFEEVDLHIHSYTHVSETTCDICLNKHSAGNSHNSEHRCPECCKTIRCRTELYEHFLEHRDYLKRNCWVCSRPFKEHITKNYSSYVCCVCGFESEHRPSIIKHNRLHLPRFYCRLCEEEYSSEEKRLHGGEFTCFECPEEFKCQTQAEAHYEEKHKNYSENCKICKKGINEHFIGPSEGKEYQCCKNECLQIFFGRNGLQDHLYSHTGLRVFKCFTCGRRFNQRSGLGGHKRQCKELPFKCEICEIRFHSSDILRAHHLVNHRQA